MRETKERIIAAEPERLLSRPTLTLKKATLVFFVQFYDAFPVTCETS
jgi:hypothetical protein